MEHKGFTDQQIAAMYESGIPGQDIAEATGIYVNAVYEMIRAAGVEVGPRGQRPMPNRPSKELLLVMLETKSQREIALELNIARRTIQRILAEE